MLTIGITTYNRKALLERMAESLYSSALQYRYNIRIYDDASVDYDESYLHELFPDAKTIYVQENNLGSDENMRYMYEDFLDSADEFFFNADSDLIFNRDWLNVLMRVIGGTDGVISAFNTSRHKYRDAFDVDNIEIVEKESLGAAGTLFRRNVVEMIIDGLRGNDSGQFDWKWSSLLRKRGIHLYSLKMSMVQHIGFTGFNSVAGNFDIGMGFCVGTADNGQAINDTIEELAQNSVNVRRRISLFPFSEIKRGSKVIIYGAGQYGRDYLKQLECIDYCEVIAVCDKNHKKMQGIIDPLLIKDMTFDYIVISVRRDDLIEEIKDFLVDQGIPNDKIVAGCGNRLVDVF